MKHTIGIEAWCTTSSAARTTKELHIFGRFFAVALVALDLVRSFLSARVESLGARPFIYTLRT